MMKQKSSIRHEKNARSYLHKIWCRYFAWNSTKSKIQKNQFCQKTFFFKMQKNQFYELTVISRFDLWKNCSPKSPFSPRFFIFRPCFLHREYGANLKTGWLPMHKDGTWNYFPSDKKNFDIRFVFMQHSCMKPKRLRNLHHVLCS